MDVYIANLCKPVNLVCAFSSPFITVWRVWTGSLIRCCPSKFWTNLKPLPTSYKRYVLSGYVFCGCHQCHESLVEKSNSVWIKITTFKPQRDLSCPLIVLCRRRCRKQRSRPCSCRKMLYMATSETRSVWSGGVRVKPVTGLCFCWHW